MPDFWIVIFILVFFGLFFLIIVLDRKGVSLDRLQLPSDEKMIGTDEAIKFLDMTPIERIQAGWRRPYWKPGKVVLTNKRIIVAHKALWQKVYRISLAINYVETPPEGISLQKSDFITAGVWSKPREGFVTFYTSKNNIRFVQYRGEAVLQATITVPVSEALIDVMIKTNNPDLYRKAIG